MSRLLPATQQQPLLDTSIPCFETQHTDILADPGSAQQEPTAPVHFVDRNAAVGQITMPIPDRRDDPDLVHLDDWREKQLADPGYVRWTTTTNVDLDEHGLLGYLLPSGERLPMKAIEVHPFTVLMENDERAREDARLLRREGIPSNTLPRDDFLGSELAVTISGPSAPHRDDSSCNQTADAIWLNTAKTNKPPLRRHFIRFYGKI
jgi:hypothetical protein